jgi:hypothetical protein
MMAVAVLEISVGSKDDIDCFSKVKGVTVTMFGNRVKANCKSSRRRRRRVRKGSAKWRGVATEMREKESRAEEGVNECDCETKANRVEGQSARDSLGTKVKQARECLHVRHLIMTAIAVLKAPFDVSRPNSIGSDLCLIRSTQS